MGGDRADGQVDGHHDAEPHGVPAEMPDDGNQDREKDVLEGDSIEQHPADQEETVIKIKEDSWKTYSPKSTLKAFCPDIDNASIPVVDALGQSIHLGQEIGNRISGREEFSLVERFIRIGYLGATKNGICDRSRL